MRLGLLLASVLLCSCGDRIPVTLIDSGPAADARADAQPDAAPDADFATSLIGDWGRHPDVVTDQYVEAAMFRADGSYTLVHPTGPESGHFVVPSAGRLRTFDASNPARFFELGFVIQNGQLLYDVFVAQGQVAGFVGTWTRTVESSGSVATFAITLEANRTASLLFSGGDTLNGMWEPEATGVAVTLGNHPETTHFRLLGGALGTVLLLEQP